MDWRPMNRFILLLLALSIGCSSYQETVDKKAIKNCTSDNNNTYELCDLKLQLKPGDVWMYQNFFIIEQYKYKFNNASKITYQIIVRLYVNSFANYKSASFLINGRSYALKARKTEHDEKYGLREILYFDINRDFIKILADARDILLFMAGDVTNKYSIRIEDIPAIKEFYDSL
jgi:hypothetical protein